MAVRLIFTIASFFFLVILLSAFLSKKTKVTLNNRLYKFMITIVIILILTDISSFLVYCFTDLKLFAKILIKLHWVAEIFTYYLLYIYTDVVINKKEYPSIGKLFSNDKHSRIICIITGIYAFLTLFVPFKDLSQDNFRFIFPYVGYVAILYFIVILVLSIIRLFTAKDASKSAKSIIAINATMATVGISMQFLFIHISFLSLIPTIIVYLLYFVNENPDLQLIKELDSLKIRIESSSKSKSDFLSNMSHEIRSPMNAIIGFSDTSLLNENSFDKEKVLNDITHIKTSTKSLLDIINNVLDISKVETGSDTIDSKDYLLKDLIMNWNSIIEARLAEKPIKFSLVMDPNLPSKYNGDSTKVYQIVSNLITNAVKYTEVGKINMTIAFERLSNDKVQLIFKVQDTGFGIKEEDKEKVFTKYTRLDSATNNEIEGTGLGLVLSKRYAELMQGSLTFESEYNVGSTFYLSIPQTVIDPTPIGNMTETIEEENQKVLLDCTGLNILVLDDDRLGLTVTSRLLEAYKANVELIDNPEKAIYEIKEGKHYDLIFVDHFLPKITGVEFMQVVKGLRGYYIPPIVMLTANAIDGVKEEYLKLGFDDYLSKPIDVNELDRVINRYLKK